MAERVVGVLDLFCPFPAAINPCAEAAEEGTLRWARAFGLLPDEERSILAFREGATGRLAARFHPTAPLPRLRLVSDLYAWMFLQDDARDESRVGLSPGPLTDHDRGSLAVLGGGDPAPRDGPSARALEDLRDRLLALSPGPAWWRRFVRAVELFFLATAWEAANRARGEVPGPAVYLRMRPATSGLAIDDELIELSGDARLFGGAREHPTVGRLVRASHNAVCWANDLFSLEKELAHGDVHNLVVVLSRHEGLPLKAAARKVVRMHDEEVRRFRHLSARLPSFSPAVDANLARYVATLEARVRGNLDWARQSARYRSTTEPTEGTRASSS